MRKVYGQSLLDEMIAKQGLPTPLVKQAAQEILEVIREGLMRDGVVNVSHFGTFRLKPVAERQGVNPQTREPLTIPAHQRVTFSPSKALRELIQPAHEAPKPLNQEPTEAPMPAAPLTRPAPELSQAEPEPVTENSFPPQQAERPVTFIAAEDAQQPGTAWVADAPLSPSIDAEEKKESMQGEATSPAPKTHAVSDNARREEEMVIELASPQDAPPRSNGRRYALGAAAIVVLLLLASPLLLREIPGGLSEPAGSSSQTGTPAATSAKAEPAPASPKAEPVSIATVIPPSPSTLAALSPDRAMESTGEKPPSEAIQPTSNSTKKQPEVAPEETPHSVAAQTRLSKNEQAAVGSKTTVKFFSKRHYTVGNGESLWRLARRYYHDPLLWPHIYQANEEQIANPDHLPRNSRIILPSLEGAPGKLSRTDRHNIAKGYYLTYLHYKKEGRKEAIFALLEAKRYDSRVVEENRSRLQLSRTEDILLTLQRSMPF